ncbi:MAG: hypothetical protein WA902_24650 [Thermosynechococcaceae cyanobacterium]
MSQHLSLEIGDDTFAAFQRQANAAGLSVAEWIMVSLDSQKVPLADAKPDTEVARQKFRRHAGVISLGYATGADNEEIDADLAKAYADEY